MKYSLRNTEELQQMQDRLLRMKESITLLQKMIADQESGLELLAIHNRRNKTTILGDNSRRTIIGVRQFADYIHKSPATAQKILNKKVLQQNDVAYLVGRTWNFNLERLDQLVADNPLILRC